ncbi:MAG: NYN domain-containing protein [Chloroflexi bacterium]|nr:NYN domain-containing protein [Chloroflexota bacterium]
MPSKSSRLSTGRENDRVMVFIDGSNLYHVLTQGCGRHDLQFDKFATKLANGRQLQRIYYYNIRQESDSNPNMRTEQQKFLDSMYDTPYVEVRLGIWKQRGDIMVEKGVDVMLATDLVTHAYDDHYDTAIVVSGDADFYPALQAVKDVGKHVEVAAFDMNLSAESARVSDVTIKLNKTFFTGLWMTRADARSRSTASSRPEVSDEAASPNGEDKAATKTATSRRSSTRRSASSDTRSRRTPSTGTRGGSTRSVGAPSRPVVNKDPVVVEAPAREESREPVVAGANSSGIGMRRTPTRRRVGGTSPSVPSTNGNGRSTPKPPALRTASSSASTGGAATATETRPETDGKEPVGSPERRRNWRGRLGLRDPKD